MNDVSKKNGQGCDSCPLLLCLKPEAWGTVALVSEYLVDDGDDVGDVEGSVVVHVALLGGEGDNHLRIGRDGAGEGVAFDVGGDVESVEDDLVESAVWLWCEGEGVVCAFVDVGCCDFVGDAWSTVDGDGTLTTA